jgi:beta-galactosidase/beta-glucuronidase
MILHIIAALQFFSGLATADGREVQSLNGTWQIVFDRNNEGRENEWFREKNFPMKQTRDISVPSCWELIEKDYKGGG